VSGAENAASLIEFNYS